MSNKMVVFLLLAVVVLLLLNAIQACELGEPGYVYILQEGPGATKETAAYFKIGGSTDVRTRISSLQTGNPRKLNLVAAFETNDCKGAENIAQEDNSINRAQYGGGTEWFFHTCRI